MGAILSGSIATTVPRLQKTVVYDPGNLYPWLDCNSYVTITLKGNYPGTIYYKCRNCGIETIDGVNPPPGLTGSFVLVGGQAVLSITGGILSAFSFWSAQFRTQNWIGSAPQGAGLAGVGGKLGPCA
jgi:hypothetical protein